MDPGFGLRSNGTCPSDTIDCLPYSSGYHSCCPAGSTCSSQIMGACCPTNADCSISLDLDPSCANPSWDMYKHLNMYFCCDSSYMAYESANSSAFCAPLSYEPGTGDQALTVVSTGTPSFSPPSASATDYAHFPLDSSAVASIVQNYGSAPTLTDALDITEKGVDLAEAAADARKLKIGLGIGSAILTILITVCVWLRRRRSTAKRAKASSIGAASSPDLTAIAKVSLLPDSSNNGEKLPSVGNKSTDNLMIDDTDSPRRSLDQAHLSGSMEHVPR